jgi:hypothetical protein
MPGRCRSKSLAGRAKQFTLILQSHENIAIAIRDAEFWTAAEHDSSDDLPACIV